MNTIVLAVLLAMLGCSDDSPSSPVADVGFDLGPLPDMSFHADDAEPTLLDLDVGKAGPFNTGYRLEEVVYEPTPGVSRKISVNIWYPTEDTEGPHPKYLKVVNDVV